MDLYENIHTQPVNELNLREAIQVPRETPIRQVVEIMRERGLGCVVVRDGSEAPSVFTERCLMKLLDERPEALDEPVGGHVAPECIVLKETQVISSLVDDMKTMRSRFAVLTNEDGKVLALTGQKGLVEFFAEHFAYVIHGQCPGTKPYIAREGA